MLLVYFIPYIYLFLCYLADRLRHDEPVAPVSASRQGQASSASAACG